MAIFESAISDWRRDRRAFVQEWKSNPTGCKYLGDQPFPQLIRTGKAESWSDFVEWHRSLQEGEWGFRGQRNANWLLYSSLDRASEISGESDGFRFLQRLNSRSTEEMLLFKFRQGAHRFLRHEPAAADLISWLALMQHHGTPTRLLDWTRSAYVAAYFAFEESNDDRHQCCPIVADNSLSCALRDAPPLRHAIWAVDLTWLRDRGSRVLQASGKGNIPHELAKRVQFLNERLSEPEDQEQDPAKRAIIVEVEAAKADEWMIAQQGFFLCKQYDRATFNQLLMSMMLDPELTDDPVVQKLEISGHLRYNFLKTLQSSNIHRGSLFPDLNGFSRSLYMDWQIQRDGIEREITHRPEPPQESDTE